MVRQPLLLPQTQATSMLLPVPMLVPVSAAQLGIGIDKNCFVVAKQLRIDADP